MRFWTGRGKPELPGLRIPCAHTAETRLIRHRQRGAFMLARLKAHHAASLRLVALVLAPAGRSFSGAASHLSLSTTAEPFAQQQFVRGNIIPWSVTRPGKDIRHLSRWRTWCIPLNRPIENATHSHEPWRVLWSD